ncbi:hypothetical protein [Nocardioides sp.]|uniref:hypothetical protein n=1 Tax=Nocardioides sp. TaxID=35761 RepID=UPI002726311C|nr:hypothetical protein [Nocardioides sp.]MDO9457871.1 hypothetical protein [Nocardioides sp.]
MPPTPSPALRRAVGATKLAVATAVALVAVGPLLTPSPVVADRAQGPTGSPLSAPTELDSLMTRLDCSSTGFGPGVLPGSALVERDARVQHVSFDDGWAVHTGTAEGELLAVCRTDL